MHLRTHKAIRRMTIFLDTAATTAAFLLGIYLRMWSRIVPWMIQLYSTVFILDILLYLFWNTYRRAKRHEYNIMEFDPVENCMRVLREKCFQYTGLIVLLAFTRSFFRISRLALFYIIVFDVLFTCICRLLLRSYLLKERKLWHLGAHYLLITTSAQETLARERFATSLPEDAEISATFRIDTDPGEEEQKFQGCFREWLKGAERTFCRENGVSLTEMEKHPFHAYFYLPEQEKEKQKAMTEVLREHRIPVSVALFGHGRALPEKMIRSLGPFAIAEYDFLSDYCEVFDVKYAVSDVETAAFSVLDLLEKQEENGALPCLGGQYICFSNVHTLMMAEDDVSYRGILNGSAYTFPDGRPIAEYQKRKGFYRAERVAGPDFMDAVFRATMDGRVSHYFYGSTQETIDQLREKLPKRYPGIRIAGMVSPPFRKETEEEDAETIRRINESGAALIWIGLGAPKQERWMAEHKGKLNGVMLGVGAGFDFYADTVKRAPLWCQKIGMEWLYRLMQDPKRLASRYIVTNAKYGWCLLKEFLHLR